MAPSYDSLRLKHQRDVDQRLTALHRGMAERIALEIVRAAGSDGLIAPDTRTREALRLAIWERAIKPVYVGSGTDALIGPEPQSPYARLLVEGITTATRIQAERQAALVRRVCKDADVVAWLTGPANPLAASGIVTLPATALPLRPLAGIAFNPTTGVLGGLRGPDGRIDVDAARAALVKPKGVYEPFHEWVDPRGYRLSDRIWNTSVEVRARVDHLLTYHVASGTSAVEIAKIMEPFLTPGGRVSKTRTPYGSEGSFSARRLARTEITAAAGRATVNAAAANPFVGGVQWRISGSHPDIDICDENARGGPNGDGIYPPDQVPRYPGHPMCLCSLLPVPVGTTAALVETLRADIQAARGNLIEAVGAGDPARGRRLQGLLSPEHLTRSLLDGTLDTSVAAAVRQSAQRLPANVRARVQRAVAPKVAAPSWKPSMSRAEAEALIAESKIKSDTYHITPGVANETSIKANGFDLKRTKFGRMWGDGVYVGGDEQTAEQYRGWTGRSARTLTIKIDVRNPFVFDAGGPTPYGDAQFDKADIIARALNIPKVAAQKLESKYLHPDGGTGLSEILRDNGYDALHIQNAGKMAGGNQVIVFDPKKVVVVND